MTREAQLLREISIIDFTMVDLGLYLDTHPCDTHALEYFNHYAGIKRRLSREFAKQFYPLTMDAVDCDSGWTWGEAPLPWEGGCR